MVPLVSGRPVGYFSGEWSVVPGWWSVVPGRWSVVGVTVVGGLRSVGGGFVLRQALYRFVPAGSLPVKSESGGSTVLQEVNVFVNAVRLDFMKNGLSTCFRIPSFMTNRSKDHVYPRFAVSPFN